MADRVTAFGGSWTFIALSIAAIAVWMLINAVMAKAFDAYPAWCRTVWGLMSRRARLGMDGGVFDVLPKQIATAMSGDYAGGPLLASNSGSILVSAEVEG